jgi:hypothetical protein
VINLVSPNAPSLWIDSIRITGPAAYSNWFGIVAGYIMIFALFFYFRNKKKKYIAYFIILYIVGYFTYTRSFIWGIFPSILLSYFIVYGIHRFKRFIIGIITVGLLVIIASNILFPALKSSAREDAAVFWDKNTGSKLASNYYGVIGTLDENPLFGIKRSQYVSIANSTKLTMNDNVLLEDYRIQETFHNQLGRYMILYGLFGLTFLIFFIFHLYKLINSMRNPKLRFVAFSLFIFLFQYSLMHNVKFIGSITFFMFLGLVYKIDRLEYEN